MRSVTAAFVRTSPLIRSFQTAAEQRIAAASDARPVRIPTNAHSHTKLPRQRPTPDPLSAAPSPRGVHPRWRRHPHWVRRRAHARRRWHPRGHAIARRRGPIPWGRWPIPWRRRPVARRGRHVVRHVACGQVRWVAPGQARSGCAAVTATVGRLTHGCGVQQPAVGRARHEVVVISAAT